MVCNNCRTSVWSVITEGEACVNICTVSLGGLNLANKLVGVENLILLPVVYQQFSASR